MTKKTEKELLKIVERNQTKADPSHDFQHVLRVLNLAKEIGKKENADFGILVPAALFHDIVVYRKDTPQSKNESEESARLAKKFLLKIKNYPKDKIEKVEICIKQCSFSKGITPNLLEAKILQDADRLEATGAISIMRTFSSGGQMNRPFYESTDPFCKKGSKPFRSGLDLFYRRLLVVEKRMHTKLAIKIAKRRTKFLRSFLKELQTELKESKVI